MNVQESAAIIRLLMRAHPTVVVQDGTEALWAEHFRQIAFADVAAAVAEHIQDSPFWPAISEIQAIIRDQRERKGTPYVPLPAGEQQPLGPDQYRAYDGTIITQKQETREEQEARWAERRYVLAQLQAGKEWPEIAKELGRPAQGVFDASRS